MAKRDKASCFIRARDNDVGVCRLYHVRQRSCDCNAQFAMGVRGLLKYIRSGQSQIKLKPIRLFKRGDEKILLVCDLMAVFYWLIELLHKAKVTCKDYSPYSAIYGGNFKDYKERILEFVKALRYINIEPIFFLGWTSRIKLRLRT